MNIREHNLPKYEHAEQVFLSGITNLKQIASIVGLGTVAISQYLKYKGHDLGRSGAIKEFSVEDKNKILELHQSGMGTNKISKEIKCSDYRVVNFLKEQGIEVIMNNQIYTHNVNVFKKIDTEEKAYWLGFLSADGYVGDGVLELTLKQDDKEHIEKFLSFISPDSTPKHKKSVNAYRAHIASKEICNDLHNLGVIQNKSLVLEFCKEVPQYLIHHYIRGYFDGDGSVGTISKTNVPWLEIIGTEQFLEEVAIFLDVKSNIKMCHGKAYSLRTGGVNAVNYILNILYKDATIYLNRKYEKYLYIKENCRPQWRR